MTRATLIGSLEGDNWAMRYPAPLANGTMERRPVAQPPERDGLFWVDFGSALTPGKSVVGLYLNGEWCTRSKRPFASEVTHWTRLIENGRD